MAVDAFGPKNEPIFYSTGAPEIDVDQTKIGEYAAKVGNRKVGTTAERSAATGKDVWEGLEWYDTTLDEVYLHTGAGWVLWHKRWTSYTPTLTNISGTPTVTARYAIASGIVHVKFHMLLTGVDIGSFPGFSLPVTAAAVLGFPPIGRAIYRDVSPTGLKAGTVLLATTTRADFLTEVVNASYNDVAANVTAIAPHTWAAGDSINAELDYEAA